MSATDIRALPNLTARQQAEAVVEAAREAGRKEGFDDGVARTREDIDGLLAAQAGAHLDEVGRLRSEWVRGEMLHVGKATWRACVFTIALVAPLAVMLTWTVAREIMTNGVDIGIDASAKARVIDGVVREGAGDRPTPEAGIAPGERDINGRLFRTPPPAAP